MLDERDRDIIARLCGDLGEERRPFLAIAEACGVSEEELFARIERYRAQSILRRFGAMIRHQRAGFAANALSVWVIPEAAIAEAGEKIAAIPEVSHCYQRPPLPDWPYTLYAMIHGQSEVECHAVAARIAAMVQVTDYQLLFTRREFKKTSRQYFESPSDMPIA
jgi:DNA-binding Lrp family transcriptional regulator